MGKNNTAGLTPTVTQNLSSNAGALTQLAGQQTAESNALFQESNPGFVSAENFYGAASTGDPYTLARLTAPVSQQVAQATAGAKQNIMQNEASGGEKNLALEQADVSQGAQVGGAASNAYLSSFNALGALAGQGTGESISAAGTGISGFNSANQGLGQLGNLQIQQKGAQLGALTSLGGDAATLGAGFL